VVVIRSRKTVSGRARRVWIYCRRSKDDGDQTISLPEQETECRRYAAGLGEVVRVERENKSGVSGFDRPVFMAMVAAAERGEFDVFLTLDISRFGRFEPEERGYWITRLRKSGVAVHHVHDDARLQGEAGQIMGAVLQAGMNDQSRKIGLRVTMGAIAAIARGCWPGGTAPFGYRVERKKGWSGVGRRDAKLVVVPAEAKVVRRIYDLRVELRLGYDTIARRLNDAGLRSRRGKQWTGVTVRTILQNEAYTGVLVRGGPGSRGSTAKFYRSSPDGPVPVGEPTKVCRVEGALPIIVESAIWNRAQVVGAEQRETWGGRPRGPHSTGLLTGLVRCGACAGPAVASEGTTRPSKRYSYVVCSTCASGRRGIGPCKLARVQRDRLHAAVLDQARRVAQQLDPADLAARLRQAAKPDDDGPDLSALEARRRRLAERRKELVLSEDQFVVDGLKDLAAEDARLSSIIEAARRTERVGEQDVEQIVQDVVNGASLLEAPQSDEERDALREVLRVFVRQVRVMPGVHGARVKPVEIDVRTPKGVADAVIGGPSSPTSSRTRSGPGSSPRPPSGRD
jgi:DNA invertase Pin-like site-specific DNA recombinase